ncbi:MAG TPA: type II toxin-antitoxin system VapC family toxin [Ferroplasma sp.]|jgi:predicted nucleic acid-binding protein|nr:type II toxin-antitoxin system VapC family toxin [Ferroplasma sp.]
MNVYLDTSAYVKRYINEANSDAIDGLFNDAYNSKIKIITSILTIGEISIVFDKSWRKQIIDDPIEMFNRFYDEVRNLIKLNAIDLININSDIMIRSSKICMDLHKPLADVIHIISSMNISSLFITADKEQNSIASSLGVKTRFI